MYLDNRIEPFFKFQGHRSKVKVTFLFFFVHAAAATRGQYSALSKA